MINTDELRQRLEAIATDIDSWRREANRIREAMKRPGVVSDDEFLVSIEETCGEIYRGIDDFDQLVVDINTSSQTAAGQVAEVGDALRLVLMEITELGTRLYGLRSPDISDTTSLTHDLVEFAVSSNGDRWLLRPEDESNRAYVEHRANEPSGGAVTRTSVATFLAGKPLGPQHDALRLLLAAEAGGPVGSDQLP